MSLLPSRPDASPSEDAEPRVVGVDSEDADAVLSALSSETARALLAAVHDEPAPPSELADRVDTSLQNVQYHLEKLEDAGAVEVVDTAYSAKGREMDVYAAADQPLVIFAGDQEDSSVLRTAIQRLVGALGVLALASLAVQALFGRGLVDADLGAPAGGSGGAAGDGGDGGGGVGGDGGGDAAQAPETRTPETTPTPEQMDTPQATSTPEPTTTGSATPQATGAPTGTPEPMATPTATARPTPEATPAPTPEPMATGTPTERSLVTETPEVFEKVTATPTAEAAGGAVGAAAGLPPGLLFFAGGAFVLCLVTAAWYLGQ
ncbi:MAG: helix-turn-helix domain-containing protein [Haloarculaceae archaeon]